jgi:hypothetical protein
MNQELNIKQIVELFKSMMATIPHLGFMGALGYVAENSDDALLSSTAGTMYRELSSGNSLVKAVNAARPALPALVAEVLVVGYQQNCLDYLCSDVIATLEQATNKEDMFMELSRLPWKYLKDDNGSLVPEALFKHLSFILTHGTMLHADLVKLEQFGERFLHHKFYGSSFTQWIFPAPAIIYRSLRFFFEELDGISGPITLPDQGEIQAFNQDGEYGVLYNNRQLIFRFVQQKRVHTFY